MNSDYTNNTNEVELKLENVMKSCKAARICSKIIFVFMMVATVTTLVSGIVMITGSDKYDEQLKKGAEKANIKKELSVGPFAVGSIEDGDIKLAEGMEIESSVPAVQKYFDENSNSISFVIGFYLLTISMICFVLTFNVWLVSTIFDIILKEGNPFADKVPKRILTSMIILTVVVAFIAGIGFAALLGLVTWAVYTITDYGRVLRIQSDETL
ncbi:MAG: hypothetical protein E7271_02370 [Lachnospiraceae bacterium]|jgi:hypothetical protein|nr:hypothetical protein [Lachnospiraceae bacterium]